LGPSLRTIGSRGELTVKLVNTAAYDLKNMQTRMKHATALKRIKISTNAVKQQNRLSWKSEPILTE